MAKEGAGRTVAVIVIIMLSAFRETMGDDVSATRSLLACDHREYHARSVRDRPRCPHLRSALILGRQNISEEQTKNDSGRYSIQILKKVFKG